MSIENKAQERTNRILKQIRRAVYFGVLIGIVVFVVRYELQTIPSNFDHLAPQRMPAGSTVISTPYDEDVKLGIGSVILYEPPGHKGASAFGVIAGMPGETVIVVEKRKGEVKLTVEDRAETLSVPPQHKLNSGVIPNDQFLILHGDRHVMSSIDMNFPDSRMLGLIPRDNFKWKIITSLNPFSQ